jgi:hypothetical protein
MRVIDRDLIRGGHYGQRPRVPHTQAEHMGAPTNAANVKKVHANPEPSTHGGKAVMTIVLLQKAKTDSSVALTFAGLSFLS